MDARIVGYGAEHVHVGFSLGTPKVYKSLEVRVAVWNTVGVHLTLRRTVIRVGAIWIFVDTVLGNIVEMSGRDEGVLGVCRSPSVQPIGLAFCFILL
jgi:hypothetical protein